MALIDMPTCEVVAIDVLPVPRLWHLIDIDPVKRRREVLLRLGQSILEVDTPVIELFSSV